VETNTTAPENIHLDGQGHLAIQALATPTGFTSGRVVTFGKVDMLYGTVEARIKLPTGFAIWPGFWLLGTNFLGVGWPQCGEIDIVDMVSDASNFYVGLHGPQSPPELYPSGFALATHPPAEIPVTDGFHTYWANWRPNYIQVGIDGTALAEYTPQSLPPGGQWVFNAPMYAILNIAVGNAYIGAPDARTPFPATMLVDWFRYTPL
jgi:beta-glucanase (GH16 family)